MYPQIAQVLTKADALLGYCDRTIFYFMIALELKKPSFSTVLSQMSALLKSWVDEGVIKADTIYGLELLNEPATAWTPDLWDVIRDQFNYGGYDEVRKVFPDPNLKVVVQTGFRSYNDYDDYMQSPVSFNKRPSPCITGCPL